MDHVKQLLVNKMDFKPINDYKIKMALDKIKIEKAPGRDSLRPYILEIANKSDTIIIR